MDGRRRRQGQRGPPPGGGRGQGGQVDHRALPDWPEDSWRTDPDGGVQQRPAVVVYSGDHLEGVFLVEVIDGKITHFYAMRNPDKLVGIAIPRTISR